MNQNIFWIFELTIREGKETDFRELMREMIKATEENENRTIAYEWTLSEDNKKCQIHERYVDSDAVLEHLGTFLSQYASRLMETGEATAFTVYGNPSADVRRILDGFNAVYLTPIGGFHR